MVVPALVRVILVDGRARVIAVVVVVGHVSKSIGL